MAGCGTKCTSYRTDNRENAWLDIRDYFGPRTVIGSSVYNNDISAWNIFAGDNSLDPVIDVVTFGKWLIWKCSYGTNNLGNLPTRNKDHEGILCIPCPYDSINYDSVRSQLWLGFVPTTTSDHGSYYMRVAQRGSVWGFECTSSTCPYAIDNSRPYFHT